MALPNVGVHVEVTRKLHNRQPGVSSGICACGAVYDYGNVVVPARYRRMCGRCAFKRGLRPGDTTRRTPA